MASWYDDLPEALREMLQDGTASLALWPRTEPDGRQGRPDLFTCPQCLRSSRHPQDLAENYCGACHMFVRDMRPLFHAT